MAVGAARRVTTDGGVWRFPPVWSPDSKKLAFGDKSQRLRYVDVQSGKTVDVDRGTYEDMTFYRWSPDSRWLAYPKTGETLMTSIWVYSLDQGKTRRLSSEMTAELEPVFDPSGHYLYFLSNRDFNLTFSGYEFDYVYTDPTRVYVGILSEDGPALFLPQSDEETPKTEEPAEEEKGAAKGKDEKAAAEGADAAPAKPVKVDIDFDGFESRVRAVPGSPSDYRSLSANADGVFYLVGQGPGAALKHYNLKDKKEEVVLQGINDYDLSADGTKVLFRKGRDMGIADAKPGQDVRRGCSSSTSSRSRSTRAPSGRRCTSTAGASCATGSTTLPCTAWTGKRSASATASWCPTSPAAPTSTTSWARSPASSTPATSTSSARRASRRWRASTAGCSARRSRRTRPATSGSPRSSPARTGTRTSARRSPSRGSRSRRATSSWRSTASRPRGSTTSTACSRTRATVWSRSPSTAGRTPPARARSRCGRSRASRTCATSTGWRRNRRRVEQASGGRIGYIHLPNTAVEGNRELFKHFYPQTQKEALIVDERYNGGGFIPDRMIALLDTPAPQLLGATRAGAEPDPELQPSGAEGRADQRPGGLGR